MRVYKERWTWPRLVEQLLNVSIQVLGKENLDNFRASLGDNDTIHNIQFTDPDQESYCDYTLYEVGVYRVHQQKPDWKIW